VRGKRAGAAKTEALKQQFAAELNGAMLRAEKRHGRVSRSRLADKLNVSTGSVYAYLNGTTLPSTELLDRLLIELKVDAADANHLATLRDSVDIAHRSESASSRHLRGPVLSADLPRDTALLYARQVELRRLREVLTEKCDKVVLCVVSGIVGVGKTALAVRAARTLCPEFPDGCLFVDLHGYAAGPVMTAEEAAAKLLHQLAVPVESLPAQPDRRTALLREQLRDRRLLLVLDNALDTAHVEPLLPTDGRCAVLITSRSNLNGLDDARQVRVRPLSLQDCAELLGELTADLPPDRLPDNPVRNHIAAQCHGLPIAVRIAAAVLRSESWPVQASTGDSPISLEVFHDGDRGVEPLFEYSVARLSPEQAHTFAMLGLHCGPTFDAAAAAALAGIDRVMARRHLRQLIEANLLDAPQAGRYAFHDLLRTFADRHARTNYTPMVARQAGTRIVEHYLARLDAADRLLTPHRHRTGMTPTLSELPYHYADYQDAARGLTMDRDNLAAAARSAFDLGLDEQCWQIAFALRGFVFIANDIDLWIETHKLALAAALRADNLYAEAVTRNNLGLALLTMGDDNEAAGMYKHAETLFARIGDPHGEHTTMAHQAWIHFHRGEYEVALRLSTQALTFVTQSGTPRHTAILLRDTALIEVSLGKYLDAVSKLLEALEMFETFGLRVDEAMACNVLGTAYHRLGALPRAHEAFERAAEIGHTAHSVLEQARGHEGMGAIAAARQDWPTARRHWRQAHTDFLRLHDQSRAETIAVRMSALPNR
jgi:tetratricopeptide (TPR) repeat protein/transcriptional regulator with XRE-family HTH domain